MQNTVSPDYAELVCQSNFTFLTGASHPQELVMRAAELGYRAIALTDECSLAGIVRAWEESERCRAAGQPIELIPGSLFYLENGSRLVVLPRNAQGYAQLCMLITRGRRNAEKGHYALADTAFEQGLDQCLALWLPARENDLLTGHWLAAQFPGRAWIGFSSTLGPNEAQRLAQLQQTAGTVGLPVAACGDVQMHHRPRRILHDVLAAIRHGCRVSDLGYRALPSGERHLRTRHRLAQLLPSALLAETVKIANQCCFRIGQLQYQYPHEVVPTGLDATGYLRQLTEAGIQKRWPEGIDNALRKQIERELELIRELRYEPYFLTVHDIVQFARNQGILCQGRGSAANSAVCYCLGITEVDPARMSMLFERFISRERGEPPDIDIDFEHERREEVIQYIYRKYGRERAALAATVITYRPRSAIRDVGKALGFSLSQVDQLARNLSWWDEPDQQTLDQRLLEQGFDPTHFRVQQLLHLVRELCRFPRHLSQHVGGFVISEHNLACLVPVENAAMPGRTIIQWDKDDLETLGLLKIDCLALGMLSAIRRCLDLINQQGQSAITLADIPAGDQATYAMIQRADTVGVFQIESRAQRAMLPRLKPCCFYDLVIEVAIVRPGPIQGNMVHPYLQRRRGLEKVQYPSIDLKRVLERTLGVPIFQEQVMQIAMVAAGFSGSEADALRRSMAAWARRGGLEHMHQRLVDGMLKRGYSKTFAEQIFDQIRGFGEYGFPESHAASFALLVYISCWMKCHHPAAFTCALLNAQPMGFYAPAQLVKDAQRHGVKVLPVDVRFSERESTLTRPEKGQPALRLGLHMVKGLGGNSGERIVRERENLAYRDVHDLQHRAALGSREMAALAEAAALRSLAGHRHRARWSVAAAPAQPADLLAGIPIPDQPVSIRPPSESDDLLADYATTGLSLGRHPLAFIRAELRRRRVRLATQLAELPHGTHVRACGLVTMRQRPMTASGTIFLTLEDETGSVNAVVWRRLWKRHRHTVLNAYLIAIDGTLESDGGVQHLIARQIHDFTHLSPKLKTRSRDFC